MKTCFLYILCVAPWVIPLQIHAQQMTVRMIVDDEVSITTVQNFGEQVIFTRGQRHVIPFGHPQMGIYRLGVSGAGSMLMQIKPDDDSGINTERLQLCWNYAKSDRKDHLQCKENQRVISTTKSISEHFIYFYLFGEIYFEENIENHFFPIRLSIEYF